MVDDRRSPKRAPTFGDLRRDQRRTPPHGAPVAIDPELTPPPQLPPAPNEHPGYSTIAPEIREQLDSLASGLGEVTTALGKVWDARKDVERLERIDSKLGVLAGYATEHHTLLHQQVWPAVKDLMRSTDDLGRQLPALLAQVEAMSNLVTDIDNRLRNLERDMSVQAERFASHRQELEARVRATETKGDALDTRLIALANRVGDLERKERDEVVAIAAVSDSDRKRLAIVRTALVVGSGLAGFLVAKGAAILAFLSNLVN